MDEFSFAMIGVGIGLQGAVSAESSSVMQWHGTVGIRIARAENCID